MTSLGQFCTSQLGKFPRSMQEAVVKVAIEGSKPDNARMIPQIAKDVLQRGELAEGESLTFVQKMALKVVAGISGAKVSEYAGRLNKITTEVAQGLNITV